MTAFSIHKTRLNRVALPWLALIVFALAWIATAALADPKFPDHGGKRVVDQANILSPATEQDLELKLKGLEDTTTDQMLVVTVDSLQGYEIEEYGYKLGRHWGVGQSGKVKASTGETYKDNGLILLIAPNERKVRIEVGYGLEPVMTDAMSHMIIQGDILPKFKSGDYDGGVEAGTDAVIQQLSIDRNVAIQKAQAAANVQSERSERGGLPIGVIIFIIIIFILFSRGWLPWFLLGNVLGGGGGGGWSGGGGGFGGGFSGGGGSFGGGGSSGSW
ncbi:MULTISPECIES: YgcG family protein [Asticcacaulis]|uniref:TPM domain-containing protein n=1 Tax=Asticcacaulis TaxID=76890 RepID=UPI001AE79F21|nr:MULTISPECIES: TPM domain-containing protein [Asticcacaulis]MBP2160876.1 uncharacterized protein [Asticcacaulis solisilvae]MDR6801920.1 uncharacterized protein [Asticcacaulis sp. BE141]